MRIHGWKTLIQTTRRARSRFVAGAVILGYHRIAEVAPGTCSNTVSLHNFAEQLEIIRNRTQPLPIREIVHALNSGKLPAGAVGVTFDDGYADLLAYVKPLLINHQVPATVFATPGYLGREFWWEELHRIVYSALWPEELKLSIGERLYRWTIPEGDRAGTREKIIHRLEVLLEPLSEEQRRNVFDQLRDLFGVSTAPGEVIRSLTADEILELSRDGMIDVGSHSMTHRSLVGLPEYDQQLEIKESRDRLEAILGRPVSGFSYPHGIFSGEVRARVQRAGYLFACGSNNDVVRRRSDTFHLPRFWIPDWNGEKFESWLRKWVRLSPA
jgi:peptidoglycan/xylan/chitin deacetylase (PgdA/CDA1 family)